MHPWFGQKMPGSCHRFTGLNRHSLRDGFTVSFVLSPATGRQPGVFVTVIPGKRQPLRNLTPATGRQDHTTSPYASTPFVHMQKARDDAKASTASRLA
jgi:hypothetical protein